MIPVYAYSDPTDENDTGRLDFGIADYEGRTYLIDTARIMDEPGGEDADYYFPITAVSAEVALLEAVTFGLLYHVNSCYYYIEEESEDVWMWIAMMSEEV